MQRLLLTNCPNCAAPLEKDGTCKYCNTKARYANEIDFEGNSLHGTQVEILLKEKRPNGEIVLYPFQGYLRGMCVRHEPIQYFDIGSDSPYLVHYGSPSAELVFEGFMKEPEEPVHISKKYYME